MTGWEKTPYSDSGLLQFKNIRNYFGGRKLKVYASDLPRALKLGKAIVDESGTEIHVSELLRERNFRETLPKNSHETEEQFTDRILSFLGELTAKECIIVTHAGVVKELINHWVPENDLDLESARDVIFKIETVKSRNKLSKIKT